MNLILLIKTAIAWRVFFTTYAYKDCMKLPLVQSRETLPAYRNNLLCTWHNSAPTSDCGGNTPLCVPIQSACHVRRRKSCSGSGPRTCLPWFNTCNKLGIKTQEYTSQNQAKTTGVPRIKQNKMCCLQRHTLKPGLAILAWLGLKVGLASIFDSKLTWPQILVWPQN